MSVRSIVDQERRLIRLVDSCLNDFANKISDLDSDLKSESARLDVALKDRQHFAHIRYTEIKEIEEELCKFLSREDRQEFLKYSEISTFEDINESNYEGVLSRFITDAKGNAIFNGQAVKHYNGIGVFLLFIGLLLAVVSLANSNILFGVPGVILLLIGGYVTKNKWSISRGNKGEILVNLFLELNSPASTCRRYLIENI